MSFSVSAPALPTPAPQRPTGLVLAAIMLALLTCMGLFTGLSILLASVLIPAPATAQFPAIQAVEIGMGVITLLVAVFCGFTVVGLFRVKRWARISILVLGGLLACFCLFSALLSGAMAFIPSAVVQGNSGISPSMMRIVFLGSSVFYLCVALIGVWWLVYFNLRRIRALFATRNALRQPEFGSRLPVAGARIESNASNRGATEILIICLAVLYIFSGASGIITALFHFPLLVFGHIFRGGAATAISCFLIVVSVAIGVGLLRRLKVAWGAALVLNALGLVSEVMLVVPSNRARLVSYERE